MVFPENVDVKTPFDPKMTAYTQLERGILDWMAEHVDIPHLAAQIQAATPIKREVTGCGSFTALSVPDDLRPIKTSSPINGPMLEAEGIDGGGTSILFLNDSGHIKELELFANGEHFSENVKEFQLTGCT